MRIVELNDYSMTITKDSEDYPWFSIGGLYRKSVEWGCHIEVRKEPDYYRTDEPIRVANQASSEAVYTAGILVLLFKDRVDDNFHLYDRVTLGFV